MREIPEKQLTMLALNSAEDRILLGHPLRPIKQLAEEEPQRLSRVLDQVQSSVGRPSIPPDRLLKSLLLIALYSVRSERRLCEQLDYNLLFGWFLDMTMVEESFDPTMFMKNREHL